MSEVRLPFWIVTQREHVLVEPEHVACDTPDAPHAFTSTRKLTAFMSARKGGTWKVELVADREALVVAIADLHLAGTKEFCFDPKPDGSGGQLVSVAQVLSICDGDANQPKLN